MENNLLYMLVIKQGKNNYRPLEWNQLSKYNKENLNTLEGIDKFTKKYKEDELIDDILDNNLAELNDRFIKFAIIYKEKGKFREVKEGIVFEENKNLLNENYIQNILFENTNNKNLYNHIINILNKDDSISSKEFIFILKNIEFFKDNGKNALIAALDKYSNLTYKTKRMLAINIVNKINSSN